MVVVMMMMSTLMWMMNDDDGNYGDDVRIRSSIHGRHLQQQFVSDYRTIVSRRPYTPEITPSRYVLFIVELSRTQDGFRSTQTTNIADFRWTHHANTPTPATPTSMQRFLSPPPLKSCNKLTLVNRQTNNVLILRICENCLAG